jgi:hypothetical protein
VQGPGGAAARGLGVIGLCAAAFTALATFLPGPDGFDRVGVLLVCAATALCSLVMWLPWWQRFGVRVTLAMVPVALTLIAVHNSVGAVDPFRYGVFSLLLFVWIGVYHRPGTALLAAAPTLVSYAAADRAGASVGIALCTGGPDEVLARADAAMYRAKRSRAGVVLAEDPAVTTV